MKITNKNKLLYILTIIVVLGGDLITKTIINTQMTLGSTYPIIKGFFSFTYVHNTGAAWSILSGHSSLFIVVAIVVGIAMLYYFPKTDPKQALLRYGMVLIFAGMLGNVYDRAVFNYVRDFLDFTILGYDFPVFNVADMGVVIGMFCIIVELVIEEYTQWKFNQSHQ